MEFAETISFEKRQRVVDREKFTAQVRTPLSLSSLSHLAPSLTPPLALCTGRCAWRWRVPAEKGSASRRTSRPTRSTPGPCKTPTPAWCVCVLCWPSCVIGARRRLTLRSLSLCAGGEHARAAQGLVPRRTRAPAQGRDDAAQHQGTRFLFAPCVGKRFCISVLTLPLNPTSSFWQLRKGTKGQFAPVKEPKNAPPDPY